MGFKIGHFGRTPLSHRFVKMDLLGMSTYSVRRFGLNRSGDISSQKVELRTDIRDLTRMARKTLESGRNWEGLSSEEKRGRIVDVSLLVARRRLDPRGQLNEQLVLPELGIEAGEGHVTVTPAVFVEAVVKREDPIAGLLRKQIETRDSDRETTARKLLARLTFPEDVALVKELPYVDETVLTVVVKALQTENNPHIALARLVQKIYPFPEEGKIHVEGRDLFIEKCAQALSPGEAGKQSEFIGKVRSEMFFPDIYRQTVLSGMTSQLMGT
ncbi:MAG: hypothetical protein WC890_02295 [Candidatus Margulisiibacteriota bacterium]